jgi:hypothetical protein
MIPYGYATIARRIWRPFFITRLSEYFSVPEGAMRSAEFVLDAFTCYLLARSAFFLLRRRRIPGDEPFCANCGYNLTGNVSGVCPECGENVCPPTTDLR